MTKNLNLSINKITNLYDSISNYHEDISKILNTINQKIEDSTDFLSYIKSHYSNLENLSDSTKLLISNHEKNLLNLGEKYEIFLNEYQEYIKDNIRQFTNTLEKDVSETYNSFSKSFESKLIASSNSIDDLKKEMLNVNTKLVQSFDETLDNITEAINVSIKNIIQELSSYSANKKFDNLRINLEGIRESIENGQNKQIVNQLEEINKSINQLLVEINKAITKRTPLERLFGKR